MKATTEPQLTDYRVVFDNNCPLCVQLAAWGENSGLVPENHTTGYDHLSDDQRSAIDLQRFRHEFALLGPKGEPTRYGLEAIGKVLSFRHPRYKVLRPGTLLFRLLTPLYHTFANNRYLALPKAFSPYKCDCEPPFQMKWRLAFAVLCLLLAIPLAIGVGVALSVHDTLPMWETVRNFFAITAPGWILLLAVMYPILGRERWGDYLVHISIVHIVGVACLTPIMLLWWLPTLWFQAAFWMCVGFSFTTMLRLHYKRVAGIGNRMRLTFTLAWVGILNTVAVTLLILFNNPAL